MHITGIALLVGNLVLVELRVWGLGRALPLPALARLGLTVSLVGFGLAAASGLLMFASQAAELMANRAFVIKMGLLTLAGANAGLFHARDGLTRLDAVARVQIAADLKLPADLAQRTVPPQSAGVDGPRLLAAARLPTRRDAVWEIEFAPLTRMEAWKVPPIKVGDTISVLGFTLVGEKGDAVLRAEYLFAGGKVYGMRSAPA